MQKARLRYCRLNILALVSMFTFAWALSGVGVDSLGGGREAYAQSSLPNSTPTATPVQKEFTASQMMARHRFLVRRENNRLKKNPRYRPAPPNFCQGGLFKPCVCSRDVPIDVQYRPSVKECGGNAGVMLYGKYLSVFSVVLRDRENRDRWPVSGYNGCSFALANSSAPPARCSAFKVQGKVRVGAGTADEGLLHCFGDDGYSGLMRNVVRVTAKLRDIPGSSGDPLERWCLNGPSSELN